MKRNAEVGLSTKSSRMKCPTVILYPILRLVAISVSISLSRISLAPELHSIRVERNLSDRIYRIDRMK